MVNKQRLFSEYFSKCGVGVIFEWFLHSDIDDLAEDLKVALAAAAAFRDNERILSSKLLEIEEVKPRRKDLQKEMLALNIALKVG